MQKLALTAALALAAACSASTFVDGDLDFDWRREDTGQYRPEPLVAAAGGAGEIVVDARLSAPSPCQRLAGAARRRTDRSVELEVRVEPEGEVCIAVIGNFAYTARLHGLEPGTWTVRVRHVYPGTGWPSGTVLETQVAVR